MKRTLKILIPLFLVVVLIAGACWFFLSYRPDFAAQFYINRAEAALDQGRYNSAVKYYGRAWKLLPNDPELAVSMADAYKLADNYTKAEYTLVSAITAHPDELSLYLALSKAYVEQDKLLDADQMLSRTANAEIQAQLEQLRPAAPQLQPEPGYYSEYVDVSVSYSGGSAYLTTTGEYPSLEKHLYTAPVTLEAGESTVVAMVVSDNGLVSPAVTAGYTIGGVIEEVQFQDEAVAATVREVLGRGADEPVMTNELWALTTLDLPETVKNLNDLAVCRSLTSLSLHNTYGVDFTVLGQLQNLVELDLSNCTVSSGGLAAIGTLGKLTSLNLSACALTNIGPLSGLTELAMLDLSGNAISDLSALSGLTKLADVNLSNNTIGSLTPLASLNSLQILNVSNNQITTLGSLKNKQSLSSLSAAGNQLTDLSPLSGCAALQILDVSQNQIADLTPVAQLPSLTSLSAAQNAIAALPDFSKATKLTRVTLNNNQLTDVSGLAGLSILNYVDVDYNQITSLDALKGCQNLVEIAAFSNPIIDVKALTDLGIIVNYDPTFQPAAE